MLIATPKGELYLHGISDGVLSNLEPMFLVHGRFKLGQAGTDLMTAGNCWVNWEINGESLVSCRCATALTKALPQGVLSVNEVLGVLELNGYVRVKVKTHGTAERNLAKPGTFTLKAESVAVLEPTIADKKAVANTSSFSGFVSVPGLKESSHLVIAHRLEFNAKGKELASDYPGVYLKSPVKIMKDELVQLTVVP